MIEFLRQLATGIAEAWGRLSLNARVQIGLAAALTLAVLAAIVFYGGQPQYARLFSRLDLDESNEIVVWLEDSSIPYRIRQGGQSIDIPVQHIPQARVGLATLDLPKSQGVVPGFELFDTRDLMTNQYLQNVDYMRALQGELQRMLNQYDFVRRSFVFIREAPEQLFVDEQRPSQATVTLDSTGPLTNSQVKAVLHTVSSFGGANLSPKNVAISLSDGTILHGPVEDEFASLASDKLEMQVALESQREGKIRRMFDQAGVNAIISVSAQMDWTTEDVRSRTMADGAVLSSMDTSSTTTTREGPPEGAPGALANIPEGLGAPGASQTLEEDKELVENFEPSETVTTRTTIPGTVQKFMVSAFIEGSYQPAVDTDGQTTGESEYVPLSGEDITKYSGWISNAVGVGVEATEIVVYDQAFQLDRITAAQVAAGPAGAWFDSRWFRWTIQALAMVLILIVIRVFMRRALVLPTHEEEEIVEIPEVTARELRRQEIASEVERLSFEEPETVAALIRTWIAEDDS